MNESRMAETASQKAFLVVVGRGHLSRFEFLRRHLEEPGLVEVIWDRRLRERRHQTRPLALERRRGERRQPLPLTWTALNFLVAPRGGEAAPRAGH